MLFIVIPYVLSYGLSFDDDYTNYGGKTTDGISWTSPTYTLQHKLACGMGDGEPRIVVLERDSGQTIAIYCNSDDEEDCTSYPGIDSSTCDGNNIGNFCDTLLEEDYNEEGEFDDLFYRIYNQQGGGGCTNTETSQESYFLANNSKHRCWDNLTGMNIWSDMKNFGGSVSEIKIGEVKCELNEFCSTALDNVSTTLANKNYSIRCSTCSSIQREFVAYCNNVKEYQIYERWTVDSCGDTSWNINTTTITCQNEYLCDLSSFDIVSDISSVDEICFTASGIFKTEYNDNWGSNFNVESTFDDGIIMNGTTINITIDSLSGVFPEEVACFSTEQDKEITMTALINGELVFIEIENPFTLDDSSVITITNFDLDKQTVIFRIENGIFTCGGNVISRYDESEGTTGGTVLPQETFTCGGDDFEVLLFNIDLFFSDYEQCFGTQENLDICLGASENFAVNTAQRDLNDIFDTHPERFDTSLNGWETFVYNLSAREPEQFNLTLKYWTHCNSEDDIANENFDNFSRTTVIWSEDRNMNYLISHRKNYCVDSITVGLRGILGNQNVSFPDTLNCSSEKECIENLSVNNFNQYGLMNFSSMCVLFPLCSDGILNGDEIFVDYGGICGICFDGILNNNETKTKFHPADYGGGYCGNCSGLNNKSRDNSWLLAIDIGEKIIPFDIDNCKTAEDSINVVIIFFVVIIMIAIFVVLFLFIIGGISITGIVLFLIRVFFSRRKKDNQDKKR